MIAKDNDHGIATGGGDDLVWLYYPTDRLCGNAMDTRQAINLVYHASGLTMAELEDHPFGPAYGNMLHLSAAESVIWLARANEKRLPGYLEEINQKSEAQAPLLNKAVLQDLRDHPGLKDMLTCLPGELRARFNELDHRKLATFEVAGRWAWVERFDQEIGRFERVDEDEAAPSVMPLLKKAMRKTKSARKRK